MKAKEMDGENWHELSKKESDQAWDNFNKRFNFIANKDIFPELIMKLPFIQFDISHIFLDDWDDYKQYIKLGEKLLKMVCQANEQMYALDWQHTCFKFNPHKGLGENEHMLLPNGDYYIFATTDFQELWFGHPWQKKVTLAGFQNVKHALDLEYKFKKIGIKYLKDAEASHLNLKLFL